MAPLLPTELLLTLNERCPCRAPQLRQLITLYNNLFALPPVSVVYGLEDTGKTAAVRCVLEARGLPFACVRCADCLSVRHLLSRTLSACVRALGAVDELDSYERTENFNILHAQLRKLLHDRDARLVLVLDGIDRQRGTSQLFLPAMARLPQDIPGLSLIVISTSPRPLHLQYAGIPHIDFPPYTRNEAITLVSRTALPDILPQSFAIKEVDEASLLKLYTQFAATVYDSIISATSSTSISTFRSTCSKLWPRFIWPMLSGRPPPGKATGWDFARLLIRSRTLFQADAEHLLVERLCLIGGAWTFEELQSGIDVVDSLTSLTTTASISQDQTVQLEPVSGPRPIVNTPLLNFFSTVVLVAAYLASHTSPKVDMLLFSRLSTTKSHRVKRNYHRRKLFQSSGTGTTGTPSKCLPKTPVKARNALDLRMAVPRAFSLERLVAIYRAIHPQGVPRRRGVGDKIYRSLAELQGLRLVVSVGSGIGGDDVEEKWRVNVERSWVEDAGGKWGIGLSEYELDGRGSA